MSAAPRPADVAMQALSRAVAHRGRLDPVWRELSDRMTMSMQRLYPVWVVIGPGLSDPAEIELRTRTAYLDSDELLGSRQDVRAGRLVRRRVLVTYGAAIHETWHAKHTKRWVAEYDAQLEDEQLRVDRRLLEEPRMEAHGVRDFPPASRRGRFVRMAVKAAVTDVIVPRFQLQIALQQLVGAPSRDLCGQSAVYLLARTLYGTFDRADLAPLEAIWREVLGDKDFERLERLLANVVWIPDGEIDPLDDAARRYREIIGPPQDRPGGGADSDDLDGAEVAVGSGGESPLGEAINAALKQARASQLTQMEEEVDLGEMLEGSLAPAPGGGVGTGAPTGRLPDRGVDRPPYPDEVAIARRFASQLLRARTLAQRRIDKRTPGGHFSSRSYMRGRAQRASGRPVTARPWEIRRDVHAPIEEPHVGLVVDTSGSMSEYEYALGPIAWELQTGLHRAGGRLAVGLFGNGSSLLCDGADPLQLVPAIRVGGGTAFASDTIELVTDVLDITNPQRPRALYVLSDGGWYDTPAGVARIRLLAELGVPTIHIAIGIEPLSIEADRVCVIEDPADALDVVADDTVAALEAQARHRR